MFAKEPPNRSIPDLSAAATGKRGFPVARKIRGKLAPLRAVQPSKESELLWSLPEIAGPPFPLLSRNPASAARSPESSLTVQKRQF